MSNLKDDLKDVKGVGDATAESILDVLAEHDDGTDDTIKLDGRLIKKAIDEAESGNERTASVYLRRANR